jgi:hypothetical protein
MAGCFTAPQALPGVEPGDALIDLIVWVPGIDRKRMPASFDLHRGVQSIHGSTGYQLAIDVGFHGNNRQGPAAG